MRTYTDLSESDQKRARGKALMLPLTAVSESATRFNDELNGDNLQAKNNQAWDDARLRMPRLTHEHIIDEIRAEMEGMALYAAQNAIYPEPGTRVIFL